MPNAQIQHPHNPEVPRQSERTDADGDPAGTSSIPLQVSQSGLGKENACVGHHGNWAPRPQNTEMSMINYNQMPKLVNLFKKTLENETAGLLEGEKCKRTALKPFKQNKCDTHFYEYMGC